MLSLEWNVFKADFIVTDGLIHGRNRRLRRFTGRNRCRRRRTARSLGTNVLTIEQDHVICDDLGALTLLRILGFPLACLQTSLDIDLAAFAEILAADFCELSPSDNIVILRALLLLALRIRPLLVGSDAKRTNILSRGRCPEFRSRVTLPMIMARFKSI
jgi:hypothetical protein